ncbi:MAG: translocation/assembly module TamB domain-containing protein [Sphingomonadales bacterium]|nr:translocation/assembly module TamB domain-containing protein [Sphingomonadales bacterium]
MEGEGETPDAAPASGWRRALVKYLLALPLALLVLLAIAATTLDSAIGHRLFADLLAEQSLSNGLRIRIGRIDGSVFSRARLEDVTVFDTRGAFLKVPETVLDWRPLAWFGAGLDIRELTLRRGTLLRVPVLKPGNPDAPPLPDFDIRIDRLAVERLTIAPPVLGAERKVDLHARFLLRRDRVMAAVQGRLGGGDRLAGQLDANRALNRFALALDVAAPRGGLVAVLTGAHAGRELHVHGAGTWAAWQGRLVLTQDRRLLARLELANRAGRLGAHGTIATFPLPGALRGSLGETLTVALAGRISDRVLTGRLTAGSAGFAGAAHARIDLAHATVSDGYVEARIARTALLGSGSMTTGVAISARPAGGFATLAVPYSATATSYRNGETVLSGLVLHGLAERAGRGWRIPLTLSAARLATGHAAIDPRLVQPRASGTLALTGARLTSRDLAITLPHVSARLALAGDLARGVFTIDGPVAMRGWPVDGIGLADADAALALHIDEGPGWGLGLRIHGQLGRIDNPSLARLAGDHLGFTLAGSAGHGLAFAIERGAITAPALDARFTGHRLADGQALSGSGSQADYGPFTFDGAITGAGPRGTFTFADPLPAAGLGDVQLAVAPDAGGFHIAATGISRLGAFSGDLSVLVAQGAPTRIAVQRLRVSDTTLSGSMAIEDGGIAGRLSLAGGGVDGTLTLAPSQRGEALDLALGLADARFDGINPLLISEGRIAVHGLLVKGHSTLTGSAALAGIGMGRLFIGRLAASTTLTDGTGSLRATVNGRRGSQFDLGIDGEIAPGRIALNAGGHFAGQPIAMPRRAVLTFTAEGWELAPTELDYAGGRTIASGRSAGGNERLDFALADMPLAISDVIFANLGLGGKATGLLHYEKRRGAPPRGDARFMLKELTRSGLLLTSRPIDIALVGDLGASTFEARAVSSEAGQIRGRLQARIADLPPEGALGLRLRAGTLAAQMRYDGPADALFRLLALDHFDLTGPIALAADVSGNLDAPVIRGSLASDDLRLQSTITGTDITQIVARGAFTGSKLTLTTLSGRTARNGTVVGSGTIGFADLSTNHAPTIDLLIGAEKAQLMSRPDMALTATGPMRILSDGSSGTIAGRLRIDAARWRLGQATALADLPDIKTREIHLSADIAPASTMVMPWRFLVDARPGGRIKVEGLGIDSNWSANVQLRGTLAAPVLVGRADLIDGSYDFAGRRFDMTRGHITFTDASPPDPLLDIAATATVANLTATVTVTGTSLHPNITFSSVPALPEEDLLARVLFGDSISSISAPEALELGAAVAALHGGGSVDPINKLRRAIGLDRLRIVPADPTIPRQTGFAAGKYLGRRVLIEVITDGRGYSATDLEFHITGWLSLLGSVSTVHRNNINLKVSRDY